MPTFSRDLVFVFAGALGFAGVASAHPFDHGDRPDRPSSGSAPERFIRSEIMIQAAHDGRADTASTFDRAPRNHAFDAPQSERQQPATMRGPQMPMLPIASDIRNRVEMRTDGDDPKPLEQRSSDGQTSSGSQAQGRANTYRAPSNQAPVPIKTDIVMKCQGGDESLVEPVVRPDDAGYGHGTTNSHDPTATRSRIGEPSQAELRDPRTYGPLGANVPSAASMVMKTSVMMKRQDSGGGGEQSDEK